MARRRNKQTRRARFVQAVGRRTVQPVRQLWAQTSRSAGRAAKTVRGTVAELIGRVSRTMHAVFVREYEGTRDLTRPDYAFWDRARRGKAEGLEIAGLLLKPVYNKIAAWAMGRPLDFRSDVAGGAVSAWWARNQADILKGFRESMALADSYVVINPDLTVTVFPPHVVWPIVEEADFSKIIGWKVIERWPHPESPATYQIIEDHFTLTERVRIVKDSAGRVISRERYPNLLSRLPIVHIPNNLSPNQMFGTAEGEALLPLLHEYGDILKAALYGNKRQGRPTPTIELKDAEALEKFFEAYGKKNIDEETGEEYWTIPFSSDEVMAIVGKFTYAQPGSFAGDTEILLGLLYLIFLEHTELPEFVLGSAVASSKASVSEQMPVFIRFIEMKRQDARRWVLEVAKIVMEYMSLMGQAQVDEDIDVAFEDLTTEDGKLKLEVVKWAFTEGLLDEQSALELAPIGIEDVEGVLKKAHEEREKKAAERSAPDYGGDLEAAIARMNGNANGNQNGAASNGRANGANGAQNGVPAGEGAAA